MALQIKPKFRQITNPNFITFFSTSSSTSSNLDSSVNPNKSSSSNNNNTRPKSSSSLSSLASFFSPAKPSPAPKPQNHHQRHDTFSTDFQPAPALLNRKPRSPSPVFSFVSSSEQPTVKVDSLEEMRKSLFESRFRYAVSPPPSLSTSTNDSTNDRYKEADFLSTLREGMRHIGPSGGAENVNRGVGSSSSPFLESLRFNKDDLNHGSGTRRSQFLDKEHPEVAKLRKPPFPYYDDADGDAWEAAFKEDVIAEETAGNDVNAVDKLLVDTLLEFHRKGLYDGDTDSGFKTGAWKKMKSRMRMLRCVGKGKHWLSARIRKLKAHWSAIHDLLTSQDCNGFRWDTNKKCLIAENDVWDAYVKAHPEASELRNTSFPFYDDLCIIWAKDRATVEDANTLTDAFEELDEAHPEAAKWRNPPFPLYNDSDARVDAFHKNVICENNALPGAIFDKDMNQGKEEGSSIVPDGLKSESRDNRGPREYRVWTIAEDRMLVDTLLEFHSKRLYHTDYGFAKGALTEMKTRMEITGLGRKESHRINNRLRQLRTKWSAIHDLLTGKNSSYFGWDSDNKCVTAENELWDAYIQVHPEAAKLRNVSFPYYHDLCIIWAKDRATVEDAYTLTDDFEELDNDEAHPEAAKWRNLPFPLYNDSDARDDAFHKNVTCENNALPGAIFDKDMNQRKEEGSSIVPDGLKSESRDNRGPREYRFWTIAEDRMLVDILLEFHSKGLHRTDYGFAKGALTEMKMRMKMKITGFGLKESYRIYNKLRQLRTKWSAIHDLLTGKYSSYFGWDSDKKCVTAENDLWDAYIQAHPEAAKLRNVSFPYYHDLCIIWAKDRVIGKDAKTPTTTDDFVEPDTDKPGDDIALSTCVSHAPNEEEDCKANMKITRIEPADYFVEAMEKALKSFCKKIEQSPCMLSQAMGLDITEKQMKINGELEKMDSLSALARYKAGYMIASDVSKLNLFFSLPEEQKKDWVTALLDGEF